MVGIVARAGWGSQGDLTFFVFVILFELFCYYKEVTDMSKRGRTARKAKKTTNSKNQRKKLAIDKKRSSGGDQFSKKHK
jgi:hypothetical protein